MTDKKSKKKDERISELENSWKRALADYKNLEKRVAEERIEFVKYSNQTLVTRMIPVLDNLELMAHHSDDKGLTIVAADFKKILEEEGLEEIDVKGKDFDFTTMEASEMVEGENGKVIEVVQKGYMFRNKILRPAKVKVGRGKKEE